MKKQITILCMLAVAALSGLNFSGCTTEETVSNTSLATNLTATSLSSSSIGLRWTRASNDFGTNTVIIYQGNIVKDSVSAGTSGASATITGLALNTPYSFAIRNDAGTSSQITWMTAQRFTNVRVFEFDSPNPSGVNISTGTPASVNGNNFDLWLDENGTSGLILKGGQLLTSNPGRTTYLAPDSVYIVPPTGGSALDEYYSGDFQAFMTASTGSLAEQYNIPVAPTAAARVLTVKTADGHLAKVEIVRQSNGTMYGGDVTTGAKRYIDLNISYQPSANMPYAGRGH